MIDTLWDHYGTLVVVVFVGWIGFDEGRRYQANQTKQQQHDDTIKHQELAAIRDIEGEDALASWDSAFRQNAAGRKRGMTLQEIGWLREDRDLTERAGRILKKHDLVRAEYHNRQKDPGLNGRYSRRVAFSGPAERGRRPRAFAAASLVRAAMALRSACTTAAMICNVSSFA